MDIAIGSVCDIMAEKINSRKRLIIFPLQKYSRPMVGGIDGNIGSVYGAPNFAQKDMIQSFFSKLKDSDNFFASGFYDIFFSETGLIPVAQSTTWSDVEKTANLEGAEQQIYKQVYDSQINNFEKTPYNPLETRIDVRDKAAKEAAVKQFNVTGKNQDAINESPNMRRMVYVFADKALKSYIDCGFFRVAATDKGFTSDLSDKIRCIYIRDPQKNNEYLPVNAIIGEDGSIDIPFLNSNAESVLDSLIMRSFNFMAGTEQQRDIYKWYQDNNGSFVTMTSALKCGSTTNYEATGFSFVLTCSDDKSRAAVSKAADFINNQQKELQKQMTKAPDSILETHEDGNDIFVLVRPPEGA